MKPSNNHDIIDLIWLPKYHLNLNMEEKVLLCVELWKKINASFHKSLCAFYYSYKRFYMREGN